MPKLERLPPTLALLILAFIGSAGGAAALTDLPSVVNPLPDLQRPTAHRWLGAEGEPLALASNEEILDFLRYARVVEKKRLSSGINRPLKMTLERDGIRAHAIFRTVDVRKNLSPTGALHKSYRDSYIFEVAAYELSRMLGLDNVPPAVLREIGGAPGSMQLWVEGARTEADRLNKHLPRVKPAQWYLQAQTMLLFDNLIYNFDRNASNILLHPSGKVWFVDHTRSFKLFSKLTSAKELSVCQRNLYHRLRELDQGELRKRVGPYLGPLAIRALQARRGKLLKQIDTMIAERGVDQVLFDLAPLSSASRSATSMQTPPGVSLATAEVASFSGAESL